MKAKREVISNANKAKDMWKEYLTQTYTHNSWASFDKFCGKRYIQKETDQ